MVSQAAKESTSKRPEFATLLEMNPLFAGLGAEAVDKIAALCGKRKLAAGEVLFLKGDSGDALYGVRRGQLRIETTTESGERLTHNVQGPGDVFGEVALLDGQPRTAGATAAEPTELFVLHRSDFVGYLERNPRVAVRLIELLCTRIRWISERMEETALLPLHARLARRLCALAYDFGADVHISQEELGVYVGAARESVNRQLQHWRKAGIIALHRGRISLLDMDRLAKASKG
jgi:CRP/FNR family cyclic AMP-dependent transcriptional regulator